MRKEEIRAILQLPRELMKDIREIDLQIDEYHHAFLHSPTYSHMPKCRTSTHHDISERLVSMEDLISAKKEAELDYAVACCRSKELIAKIPNTRVGDTLHKYYILGRDRREIAEASGLGYHAVYQQIERALTRLSEMEELGV